jgi:hypothetical protein
MNTEHMQPTSLQYLCVMRILKRMCERLSSLQLVLWELCRPSVQNGSTKVLWTIMKYANLCQKFMFCGVFIYGISTWSASICVRYGKYSAGLVAAKCFMLFHHRRNICWIHLWNTVLLFREEKWLRIFEGGKKLRKEGSNKKFEKLHKTAFPSLRRRGHNDTRNFRNRYSTGLIPCIDFVFISRGEANRLCLYTRGAHIHQKFKSKLKILITRS